jgi:hypothetical protein
MFAQSSTLLHLKSCSKWLLYLDFGRGSDVLLLMLVLPCVSQAGTFEFICSFCEGQFGQS